MRMPACVISVLACVLCVACSPRPRGVVIAHRGASRHLPEHTLEAYALAHAMNADMIEPDVVATRDGVLICAHDLTMETTTDVAEVYPGRARDDGKWYWIDFDLDEIRVLHKHGRGDDRDTGYGVATFEEMLTIVRRLDEKSGRTTAVIPEIKHPGFHADHGVELGPRVVATLARFGCVGPEDAAVVQCFDLDTLARLHDDGCGLRLVWLFGEAPAAADLRAAAAFCHGLGPKRTLLEDEDGRAAPLVAEARRLGLALYPYTFDDDGDAVERFLKRHRVAGVFCNDPAVLGGGARSPGGARGVVVAHRGASWQLPEHTLPAYALAHGLGADFIEPDVVLTRDGVPICAHDLRMGAVTDVEAVYPDRARADGRWYWIDFDLAEVRRLGRSPRNGPIAPGYRVCTLDEMLRMVGRLNASTGRTVGVFPELKDPAFHAREGRDIGAAVAATLGRHGYTGPQDPAIIQSFSLDALEGLRAQGCRLRMAWAGQKAPPEDAVLDRAARVCAGLILNRELIEGPEGETLPLVGACRGRGLAIWSATFRSEPEAAGRFLSVHRIDGVFCDDPSAVGG